MMARVGSEASFDQGRDQLQLAGLEVTTKAVERQAEGHIYVAHPIRPEFVPHRTGNHFRAAR